FQYPSALKAPGVGSGEDPRRIALGRTCQGDRVALLTGRPGEPGAGSPAAVPLRAADGEARCELRNRRADRSRTATGSLHARRGGKAVAEVEDAGSNRAAPARRENRDRLRIGRRTDTVVRPSERQRVADQDQRGELR